MEQTKLYEMIDQTGIETIYGAAPAPLPEQSTAELQALREWGLPKAVVRVHKRGPEPGVGQRPTLALLWAFVLDDQIVQLRDDTGQGGNFRLESLPDSGALLAEIERLLPLTAMPRAAYARAVIHQRDVGDIFDLSIGSGLNVATEILESDGLTEEDARVAFDVIRTSTLSASISFMAVEGNDAVLTYGLSVAQDGDDVWLAHAAPMQSDGLVLETVLEGAFRHQLEVGWSSLDLI